MLTDIRMPPTHTNEGIEAAKRIRAEHPAVGVVVLSQYVEEDYAFELLVDGVTGLGYLLKERVSDVDELVRALREVSRGGSVLDPQGRRGAGSTQGATGDGPLLGLTEREREVLQEMATGRNNATIATTLFMSERAVEKHIGAVFQKLGLADEQAHEPAGDGGPRLPGGQRPAATRVDETRAASYRHSGQVARWSSSSGWSLFVLARLRAGRCSAAAR